VNIDQLQGLMETGLTTNGFVSNEDQFNGMGRFIKEANSALIQ
jgi:hypothetical protein